MLHLLFAILSSAGIFVCFKYLERYKVDILLAIIINYITASVCGYLLSDSKIQISSLLEQSWFSISIIIGIAFIVVFFIIGRSTQKAGISITTLASKMSFVLPMIFSIVFYQEPISLQKIIGFILAISAVLLSIYKDQKDTMQRKYLWLPILLFFGAGTVDSLVKYAQEEYLSSGGQEMFSTLLFAIAAISGLIVLLIKKQKLRSLFQAKVLIGGTLLGLVNFGSLHFLIASLNHSGFDSSIVFSIINIGIVSISVLIGIGVFRERLNKINLLGIVLAIIAIFILTN
ncbi:EamA family transporter [Marinifilum caeruleilacunae]|uniref:EamA/RhaT family transporter n=1 Tax=Marinifilum caeruleilacunae TaxID=2499076 RepID=A0ABX1WXF1_9BACT|nr:EamA family transporter [Marinifilum caeruleilacunae]NOU60759.1 EamA/RhaT family transporter [Marinifilum caeruleilacunae]